MLSILAWVILLEKDGFDHGRFHNLKLIGFLMSTLPATIVIFSLLTLVVMFEELGERRKRNKQIEDSKWGVFKRQVLIEKYCDHRWQDLNRPVNFLNRTKKFLCIKCKKKIDIHSDEYSRLRDFGMIVDDYGFRIQERMNWW